MECGTCGSNNAFLFDHLGVVSLRCPDCGSDVLPSFNQSLINKRQTRISEMDEIKMCPDCGKHVLWGNMIWLNGKTRCPDCHEAEHNRLRRKEDTDNGKG